MSFHSGNASTQSRDWRQRRNECLGDSTYCFCVIEGERLKSPIRTSWTEDNPGRRFYGCQNWKTKKCRFFKWYDEPMGERAIEVINELRIENLKLTEIAPRSATPTDLEADIGLIWDMVQDLKDDSKRARNTTRFLVSILFVTWLVLIYVVLA
ncbi:uncharacterized protein LOC130986504 [Salvia miltiorrhiza]|uniref:uncharacterized protein LOC130986504 n=1 Tax=Salvia miltiorrhiza TaxID=226208 RepID=UPI0025AC7C19|nr:uncharacterized protein LOC130986504 [Salvia miltiorrhiza]